MSFLVKAVLGQRVVHPPPSHRAVEGTATTSTHAEAEDESGAADREFEKTPRIPTRTLLLRAKTCTVVQDLREALRELERSDDLAALATTSEVSFLTHLLRRYPEDDEIGKSTLHLLASLGDASSTAYRSLDMEMDEKVAQSGGFLDELLSEVPLFMEHLSKSASDQLSEDAFWAKFHALQLLQQLEEHEPSKMHRLLLSCHGMSALLVTLNDSSNDGMLRNETLVLLKSLTTMDTELQTILAFDNAFEVLFSVIESENGIHGGMIVDDCFTTMRNMLRGNKATQKFFRELDCAKRFCPILDAAAAYSRECERGRPTADPIVQMDGMERQITRQAVSIIACLLRESEKGDEQAANLFQCGVLHSLTGVATCCGEEVVDDLTRIEAFRAIAQVLRGCSRASDDFLKMRIATTPNDGRKNGSLGQPAISGILEVLFHRTDATVLNSVMQVVEELLSPTDAAHNQRFARFALHGFASEAVTAPPGPQECGYLLARALFGTSSSATSTAKFYAALFFQRLLQVPGVAEELLHRPWGSVMGKPTATRGADLSSTCFLALLEYFLQSIRGGLLAQSMDTTALGGFARVFLTWMEVAPTAAGLLTKDLQHFHSLLDLAARPKTPVHVRFWCGAIAADVCLRCPQLSKLPGEFVAKLGSSFFTNAVFDVAANSHQWSSPAALLTSAAPPLYDDVFVLRLSQIVEEMSRIMEHHSGQQEPAPRTSFSSDDINPFAVPSMAVEEVVPHTAAVPSSDATLSLLPSMDTTTAQTVRAEEMVLLEQRYSNSQEELGRLCGDIESLRGENARLMELLANERARSEEVAAVNAQLESHVQLQQEAADHGDRQLEEMLTSARHQIASLEEALGTREEEHQTLLVSLGALEEQLRQATSSFQMEMERVSSTLQQVTQERDELLLLVGHLDVECESVRAGSASVSPSRLGVSPRFGGDAGMVAAPLHYVPVPYHDESGLFGETVHQAPLPQPDAMSAGATEVPPQPLQHTLPAGTPELAHSGSLIPTSSHDNYQFGIIPIELETSASHIVPSLEKSQERPFNQSPAQVEADVFHPERSAPPPALVESCQSVDGFVNPSASGSRHLWANVNGSASNPFDTAEDACNVAAFQGSLELQPSQLAGCTPLAVTNADFNPFAGDDDDELDDLR